MKITDRIDIANDRPIVLIGGINVLESLDLARAARAGGDRLLALRLYFAALVVGLSRLGSLDFRESWTNHELALRGAHTPELRALLVPLVDELDPLVYGGRAVTDAHLDRLEALCRGIER